MAKGQRAARIDAGKTKNNAALAAVEQIREQD